MTSKRTQDGQTGGESGKTFRPTVGTGSGVTDASYVIVGGGTGDASLTEERTLTGGTGIDLTDGGANSTVTMAIDATVATLTGSQTLTNKTITTPTLTLKQSAGAAPTAEGDIQWDTDDDLLKVGDGTGTQTFYPQVWSGKEVGRIMALAPPDNTSADIATGKTFVGAGTPAQLHSGVAFSGTASEYMAWKGRMLYDYDNSTDIVVQIPWIAETHSAAGVRWDVYIGPIVYGSDDLDTTSLLSGSTVTSVTDTSVTQGVPELATVQITRSNAGNINAGDGFYLLIMRDHDHAGDTLSGSDAIVFPDIMLVYP